MRREGDNYIKGEKKERGGERRRDKGLGWAKIILL